MNFLAIIWLNMSKLDYFLFSYRKSQTQLCKLFLHVSQQNSINVCTSTKERSLFAVLVLRSSWFRYILSEAVQSNPFHQITCTLSWFPGALYCTCVLSVADIVFCLLQTEYLALSALFLSFSFLLNQHMQVDEKKIYIWMDYIVLFWDFHIHVHLWSV